MIFYGVSDVGRRRQNNQDSFGYVKIAENAEVYVVCDGMGGANGGNIASEMSVAVFTDYMKNALGTFVNSETGRLVLPEDSDLLGPYAATAEFSCTFLSEDDIKEASGADAEKEGSEEVPVSDAADAVVDEGEGSEVEQGTSLARAEDLAEADEEQDETEEYMDEDESDDETVSPVCRLLREAAAAANREIYARSRADKSLSGMGTTLVAALVLDGRLYIASVGDSRIYLFCGGDMVQLTHDHSYVQYLIDIGQITPEQALTNPYRNVITRAVGNERTIETDTSSLTLHEVPTYVLLCSDGLTNYVDEANIRDIVWGYGTDITDENESEEELRVKCESLVDAANEGGGGDNITALLVKYTG